MNYAACPKCSHSPLPADQSLPAACPAPQRPSSAMKLAESIGWENIG